MPALSPEMSAAQIEAALGVPEPTGVAVLVLFAALLLDRRHRRRPTVLSHPRDELAQN